MTLLLPITLAILISSILSGVFGMAGGLLLMGVLGFLLPLPQAMVLHGLLQAYSNGYRVFLYRQHIQWRILGFYFIGLMIAQTVLYFVFFSPNRILMLFVLGSLPLISLIKPLRRYFSIQVPTQAILCGFVIQSLQLIAGAAGPILDIFYINTTLTRQEIMGTKAFAQTISHLAKILFYFQAMQQTTHNHLAMILATFFAVSTLGNEIGHRVLDNMDDTKFKSWALRVCLFIGGVYLCKGLHEGLFA